jgi:protein-L-isoaspartate(D-aspartate) O-methyltransferase
MGNEKEFDSLREMMVKLIIERGVSDRRVIQALKNVKRHMFVPENLKEHSYDDGPLLIGFGQTISQPYIVAYMTAILELKEGDRVLEVGTGSGYQTAVLAELVDRVYSLENIKLLTSQAKERLDRLHYSNIHIKVGSGFDGWDEHAPYDAIMVTAAPSEIPKTLVDQLKEGGRMALPVGIGDQELILVTKHKENIRSEPQFPVRFVPMVESESINEE